MNKKNEIPEQYGDTYKDAKECLYMMSHPYEDPQVLIELEKQLDITVSDDPDDFTGKIALCTKVREPYKKKLHEKWKKRTDGSIWTDWNPSDYRVFEDFGRKYIEYTACQSSGMVGSEIAQDYEQCGIEGDDLPDELWEKLTEEEVYRDAERGMTRELIAVSLAKKYGIDW